MSTTDNTVRAAVDSVGLAWGSLRLQYDRSIRKGEGLDEENNGMGATVLAAILAADANGRERTTKSANVKLLASYGLF